MIKRIWWKCGYCGHHFYYGSEFAPETCPKCHRRGVEPVQKVVEK